MRDRNLSFKQFHIQLEKTVFRNLNEFETGRISFSQELSLEFRPSKLHSEVLIRYPKDFRLLRVLCIVQWYFSESFHFLAYLSLTEREFTWLTEKQRIELSILLFSKSNMEKYLFLTERYSGSEIFGNILKNDLKDLLKRIKISRKFYPRPRKKVWRRGPKDKGSRRVNSSASIIQREISSDCFILKEEEKYQRKRQLLHATSLRINNFLEKVLIE